MSELAKRENYKWLADYKHEVSVIVLLFSCFVSKLTNRSKTFTLTVTLYISGINAFTSVFMYAFVVKDSGCGQ